MKRLLLLILLIPVIAFSQCPDSEFNSQAEIDAFATNYPDCTELGSLRIEGDDITDLSGLNQITEVSSFNVSNNPLLPSLDGLNPNLVITGFSTSFRIRNNASLININNSASFTNGEDVYETDVWISDNPLLSNLIGIPINFYALTLLQIDNNDSLTNLEGLLNLDAESLYIDGNNNLIDLMGLDNFSLQNLSISDNVSLQRLGEGLNGYAHVISIQNNQNLTDISDFSVIWGGILNVLTISDNPNLAVCSSDFVCSFIATYDNWYPGIFENNAPGCNTSVEVDYSCGWPSNDDCIRGAGFPSPNPTLLELGEVFQANNEFATTSLERLPSCNEVADRQDVWFAFDSGENTTIDIITNIGYSLQLWEDCPFFPQIENACGSNVLSDIPVTTNTIYSVQVWNDDGGRRPSGWFNILVQDGLLSTPEIKVDDISIYPNPAQNELHIQSSIPIDTIQMFNLLGQQVLESKVTTLDISNLTEGLYIVKVFSNARESTYKIVKQ